MKKLLLFMFAIVAFAACEQAPIEEQSAVRQDTPETITVGFEGDDTRIQLNEAQKTVWTKGDLVSVFYRSNANQQWKYDGETGARTAELKRVDAGTATRDMDRVVVVYPYNEDYYINPETYNVQASLPAVQNYLKDSYGTNGNIMISSSEYNQFSLKSVCGWLKLQLTGDGETIKSIKFRGNDGEQVAGELYINSADATVALASDMGDADDNNAGGNLVFEDTILTEVTLDCGEGVALGKETTAFYIALPPQTFEQGFTIEVACVDGSKMVKSSNKVLSIERNHIQPMVELSYTASISPSNQIWYTATSKIEPYYSQNSYWPDYYDITSNEWDKTTGKGVITFSDEVSSIGQHAFSDMSSLKGITLPNSITYINSYAFEDCSNLTSVTIPNSVTGIGIRAFKDCIRLEDFKGKFASADGNCLIVNGVLNSFAPAGITEYTIPNSVTEIGVWVFNQCSDLTSIIIPNSVTKIGEGAFAYCSGITDITIPNNVTEIGEYAFYLCTQLENIYVTCVTPPSVGDDILSNNMQNTTIYVPAESVKDYMSHSEWCAYAIVGYDFETGKIVETEQPNNQIWYTSSDDNVVTPYYTNVFGATIKSNRYSNGKGVITFDGDVTTIGEDAFCNCDSLTSVNIPDSVTSIGKWAFYYCTKLTSVNIPDSVTSIGKWAFYYCTKLTSVTIPDSVTTIGNAAFSGCDSLTEFTGKFAEDNGRILVVDGVLTAFAPAGITEYNIPDSVTTIGDSAFFSCDSLTSVNIPDSVTTIEDWAFECCRSLTSVYCKATTPPALGGTYVFDVNGSGRKIYVPAGSVNAYKSAYGWSEYADCIVGYNFATGVVVEEQPYNEIWYTSSDGNIVTPYKTGVFGATIVSNTYNNGIGVITFDGDVTKIGDGAFYGRNNITFVSIPYSVKEIGDKAFACCHSIKEFTGKFAEDNGRCLIVDSSIFAYAEASGDTYTIPDNVTTIADWAFDECTSLTSIIITDSVTTIGKYAFTYCDSLTNVEVGNSVTSIDELAFRLCKNLKSLKLGNSIITIGKQAFEGCAKLTDITFPSSLTTIGAYTFCGCDSLTSVNLPDNITSIGYYAFGNCEGLTSVTIGDSITVIAEEAFGNCSNLTSLYCKSTIPPTGYSDMFKNNAPGRKIYVPSGSVDAYRSAEGWSEYASAIVGYDFENGVVVE